MFDGDDELDMMDIDDLHTLPIERRTTDETAAAQTKEFEFEL